MSGSLLLACLWALAAALTALLPMRRQYLPGLALLIAAPLLLAYVAVQHGPWPVLAGLAAIVSMFRRPLRHLWRWLRGKPSELPQ